MRKIILILLLISIGLAVPTAQADTIHLKNGSVLKGKVASFADDLFVVMLDTGSGNYMSKAMIYMGDVARIEFDSASGTVADNTPVRNESSTILPNVSQPRVEMAQPERPPVEETVEDPRASDPLPTVDTPPSRPTVSDSGASERPPRKLTGLVRTANIDVVATRDWTSTGLIVKRGDLIRITSSGTITIDPLSGRTSEPEGMESADTRKLMSDRPTGALIGVIGADNDDFIFIGRSAEFTAVRDGLLFLSINEGTLSDNEGAYKALIELQVQGTGQK